MTTVRDVMSTEVHTVDQDRSLVDAAVIMRDHGVGALPVLADDGRLVGIVTDRDIVVDGVATGRDLAATAVTQLVQGVVSTVSPDDDIARVVATMGEQQVKRLVVLDGREIVGMVSEADLARHVDDDQVLDFVKTVYGRG